MLSVLYTALTSSAKSAIVTGFMEQSIPEQISQLIGRSKKVLIALPAELTIDCVAAGLGLAGYLEKIGKTVTVLSAGSVPKETAFLSGVGRIQPTLTGNAHLVVAVNSKDRPLDELWYEVKEGRVEIYLRAKEGIFTPEDVTVFARSAEFDSVWVLGAGNLEALGGIFASYAEVFYSIPKVNIDIRSENDYFGAINIVDVTAVALAEVIFDILQGLGSADIGADTATALLCGITANTGSFQAVRTTPKALLSSAELIGLGARQQDVVRYLYKTKDFALLKLWGRALARLVGDDAGGFAYAALSAGDFAKTDATASALPMVLQECVSNISDFRVIALLAEVSPTETIIVSSTHPQLSLDTFVTALGAAPATGKLPGGQDTLQFTLPISLVEAESKLKVAFAKSLPTPKTN